MSTAVGITNATSTWESGIRVGEVVIAVAGEPDGIGGGVTLARAVRDALTNEPERPAAACRVGQAQCDPPSPIPRVRIIGWSSDASAAPRPEVAPLAVGPFTWRFATRTRVRRLAAWLRTQPRPERFIAVSPFWVLAARRAWPDVCISFAFPCLLSNCLPFTWPARRPPDRWSRLDYECIRRIERRALAVADRVVVQTPLTADEVLKFAPEAEPTIRICRTGAPTLTPPPAQRIAQVRHALGVQQNGTLFLWAGHLDHNKDPLLAVRAFSLTRSDAATLIICGDGPLAESVRTAIRESNLDARVRLLGDVPRYELPDLYLAANALILTSHYDTFPNVIVEAMAAGRPAIVPDHAPPNCYSGAAHLVDERTGWRYNPSDPQHLAAVMQTVAGDPGACVARGESARRLVRESCSWHHYTAALLAGA